jgi:solute carrier family 34 (sodium-dependent phosphate cotransporter)
MAEQPKTHRAALTRVAAANGLILRFLALVGLLYLFILSITLLGAAFKMLGSDVANAIMQATANPLVGVAIGILATSVIQSSSTTTSVIVGMVGSGTLSLQAAVPIIMGSNIGTSVTNTLVSLFHIQRRNEFKAAFTGGIVHDFFNICSVIVLLPLQIYFNVVGFSAEWVEHALGGSGGLDFKSPLKVITKPVADGVLSLLGDNGWLGAIVALILLFVALRFIVKVIKSLVLVKVERFFQRYIFRTPVLGLVLGIFLTVLVQSSSITTSLVIPLIGAGVLTLTQVYPYMLGANIGTTITAFMASLATGSHSAVAVAFAHLTFNCYGIAIFWPLKCVPIWLSMRMADLAMKSKLIPLIYLAIVFYAIPLLVITLG